MVRLRTVSPNDVGWTRRRHGRGFTYLDETGIALRLVDRDRCVALVIPPAWQDVWICRFANGHIQATGSDDAGRTQYIYHPDWRVRRDLAKHERVLKVARRLPRARKRVAADLDLPGMPRERTLAAAFRLLDLGFFRVGNDSYTEHGSYGLSTLHKEHVVVHKDHLEFDFMAKSGKEQHIVIYDDQVRAVALTLRRRRSGIELLAYQEGRRWRDVKSDDVNAYVREVIGDEMSAKDFRTWHATVLAAVALAVSVEAASNQSARKRAIARAMREVADYLGNTPAVARASYVDPRVVDLFEKGVTIVHALPMLGEGADDGAPATHGAIERAVLKLLS